jgi:hypothetical protein
MKRLLGCLAALLTMTSCDIMAPRARITVRIVDEQATAVADVPVKLEVYSHTVPSPDFGRDVWDETTKITDAGGTVTFTRRSPINEVVFGVYPTPAGFYEDSGMEFLFDHEPSWGRWRPWNPTVTHVLKRIVNPVPMHVRYVGFNWEEKIPVMEEPVGFDLVKSDWVKPHGEGEVPDFVFWLKVENLPDPPGWNEKRQGYYHLYRTRFRMSFSNEGDGIQPFYVKLRTGSELTSPSLAPEDGYAIEHMRRSSRPSPEVCEDEDEREDVNYLFRVRSVARDGKVVQACHGKIYGNIDYSLDGKIRFLYYLNPDPTSRSLEFDTKRNLCTPREGEHYAPGP